MEAVDIFLFCVVGLSVVVFLVVDSLKGCRGRSLESEISCVEGDDDDDDDDDDDKQFKNVMSGSLDNSSSFDDWEGIERTELERSFGEAMVYVNSKKNNTIKDEDVKLQLYALQMLVLQGSCHGSKPMPFNLSARAKWNAWQKLRTMSRETAMEEYLIIVANAVPGWKGEYTKAPKDVTDD